MCSEREIKEITHVLADVYKKNYGAQLNKVYLYGSYARGDYDASSDIDIVGIVKEKREDAERQLKNVWDESFEIAYQYDVVISPMVIPLDEFERGKQDIPYYRNILNEGIEINA